MSCISICDGGVMVSIVAFQAVDPGSIPGHRRNFFVTCNCNFMPCISICDGGVMVSIVAFQAVDPGSIPGHRRNFVF
ncbi:hypothetical protein DMN91_003633 [Ooceraea biroi]|uniref:Uncharacterized protein n=1 Tax=Ooceraea biroi TaxID=2015173 RepID=A0A3L8DU53_OOCBI|nr:hypothetical protein DMN91_003633 [Ooceraea biroi]